MSENNGDYQSSDRLLKRLAEHQPALALPLLILFPRGVHRRHILRCQGDFSLWHSLNLLVVVPLFDLRSRALPHRAFASLKKRAYLESVSRDRRPGASLRAHGAALASL